MIPTLDIESVFAAMFAEAPALFGDGQPSLRQRLKSLAEAPDESSRLFPVVSHLAEGDRIPAAVLVLLSYPRKGDPALAKKYLLDIRHILSGLNQTGNPAKLRSKQVDQTVAYGAGADATPGTLAEVKMSRTLIYDQSREVILHWIGSALGNANDGILSPLNRSLRKQGEETLEDMSSLFRWVVWERFTASATHLHDFSSAKKEWLQFSCSAEGVLIRGLQAWREVLPFKPVPPGCRRVLQLWSGRADLTGPREFVARAEAGTRLVIRALNETESLIQVMNGVNAGPTCTLREFEWARLDPIEGDTSFGELVCTCGTADCEQRHCILGWKEMLDVPDATLASFVFTATAGAPRVSKDEQGNKVYQVVPEAFRGSMYYAVLAEGVEE